MRYLYSGSFLPPRINFVRHDETTKLFGVVWSWKRMGDWLSHVPCASDFKVRPARKASLTHCANTTGWFCSWDESVQHEHTNRGVLVSWPRRGFIVSSAVFQQKLDDWCPTVNNDTTEVNWDGWMRMGSMEVVSLTFIPTKLLRWCLLTWNTSPARLPRNHVWWREQRHAEAITICWFWFTWWKC